MADNIISKGRVSATRGAAILGMSPYMTAFRAWQDIMEKRQPGFNVAHGYDYEPFEGNTSTRWGKAFEDAIIKLSEERMGSKIIAREFHAFHSELDYVHCYLDGIYDYDPKLDAVQVLHEGKTTTAYGFGDKWGEPGSDKIPVEYQIQVQHQMLCTGADECIVSVLVFPKRPDDWEAEGWYITEEMMEGFTVIKNNNTKEVGEPETLIDGDEVKLKRQLMRAPWYNTRFMSMALDMMGYFHQYRIPADRDLHALMLDKYRVWWTKYVIGETPPAPANYADIRAMITAPVGTIIVDRDTARWFKERKDINEEIGKGSNLSLRSDQLKTLILERAYVREHEMCPHDKMLTYDTCHGECGQSECSIGKGRPVLDDESTDKWIFRDDRGNKLGSYGRTKSGNMVFR